MSAELKNLDRIPESLRGPMQRYIDLVRQLDGDNLLAVTLYGAVAAGSFDPRVHSARSVLVFESVNLWKLYHLADHGVHLGKARIAAPLIMTPAYIKSSLDTFPLELIEIHQQHMTVLGDDHFADLAFDDAHVRLQCERELKTMMIRMRQGLLAAAGREKMLCELESDILECLFRTFRGILWLKGEKQAKARADVLAAVEELLSQELPNVHEVIGQPENRGWDQFRHLYKDVEKLGAIVDAW